MYSSCRIRDNLKRVLCDSTVFCFISGLLRDSLVSNCHDSMAILLEPNERDETTTICRVEMRFVFVAVLFHGDQFGPQFSSMAICFNGDQGGCGQFQPELAASLFFYLCSNSDSLSEQLSISSWIRICIEFLSSFGFRQPGSRDSSHDIHHLISHRRRRAANQCGTC
jgi:hypothetical protein